MTVSRTQVVSCLLARSRGSVRTGSIAGVTEWLRDLSYARLGGVSVNKLTVDGDVLTRDLVKARPNHEIDVAEDGGTVDDHKGVLEEAA